MSQDSVLKFLKEHEGVYYSADNISKFLGLSIFSVQANIRKLLLNGEIEYDYFDAGDGYKRKRRVRYISRGGEFEKNSNNYD